MIKYKFITWKAFEDSKVSLYVSVEKPYEFLGDIFMGNESSNEIQELIDNVTKVKNAEEEMYSFGNQSGFDAVAHQPDSADTEIPNGCVDIYDAFGGEDPVLTITLEEMLQLLIDFKSYLVKNNR